MPGALLIDLVFLGLAALFGALAWRDHRRGGGRASPAARTWRRLAVAFLVVGLALLLTLRLDVL